MKKRTVRNIIWIALVAVWSFLAGAYFNLGWVRNPSVSFLMGFILGGIAIWIVFAGMGVFVYQFAKKKGSQDAAKPALGVLSFFTLCFLLIAWVRYDEVQKDKFVEDIKPAFVLHYKDKALAQGIKTDLLDWELEDMYSSIRFDLRRHPQLEELMQLKTADAVFEENTVIAELCIHHIESAGESGHPFPAGMQELFLNTENQTYR